MKRSGLFWLQLIFTLSLCLFMVVPIVLSLLAGVTENYFIGLKKRAHAALGCPGLGVVRRHDLAVATDRRQLPRLRVGIRRASRMGITENPITLGQPH